MVDEDATEDALRATFATAFRRADRMPRQLGTVLYATARRECLRRAPGHPPASSPPPADAADAARLVWTAGQSLDEDDREMIELALRHGLAAEEVATVMGLPPRLTAARLALARSQLERSLGALLATDPPDRRAPEALMAAYATLPFPAVGDHVWKRVRQAIPTTSGKRAARFGPLRLVMAVTAVSLALVAGWALARSDARPGPAAAGPPVVPAQIGGVPTSGSAVPESTDTPGPRGATASPSRSPSASPSPSRKPTPTSVSATSKAPGPFSVSASSSEKNCPLLGGTEFTATATVSGTPASSVVVHWNGGNASMSGSNGTYTARIRTGRGTVNWHVVATATDGRTARADGDPVTC